MIKLLSNSILITVIFSTVTAQVMKALIILITDRQLVLNRLIETGGMPSSHSAAVSALATSMGLVYGWNSPYFTISVVLAAVVIHDATGVRRAAGKHAEILNDITKQFANLFGKGFEAQTLKTLLGHTYPQAVAGTFLGVGIALAVYH